MACVCSFTSNAWVHLKGQYVRTAEL